MNPSSTALIANGDIHDLDLIRSLIIQFPFIIAVDGGLVHCDRMKVLPNLIVGDFDSIPVEMLKQYQNIPMKRFPTEKNETDLELAVKIAFDRHPSKICLFGVLGKRLDHTISNLNLAGRYPDDIFIYNENELIFFVNDRKTIKCEPNQTISIISWNGKATGVSTQGLKWELNDALFDKDFFSQSNICLKDEAMISCKTGQLLVCIDTTSKI